MQMLRLTPYFVLAMFLLGSCQREETQPFQPDTIPPLPPAGIGIDEAHDGLIAFSWLHNTEYDLDMYIVYRREPVQHDFEAVDTTFNRFYVDVQRSYDTTYEYYVVAVDQSGNRSAPSHTVSSGSPNLYPPGAVQILYATGHSHDNRRYFRIEWAPVDAYDVSRYAVYRSGSEAVSADTQHLLGSTNATFLVDSSDVQFNQIRYYAVTVVDRGGKVSELSTVSSDFITAEPELLSPGDMASVRDYPVFTWNRVAGAVQYRLGVSASLTGEELWSETIGDDGRQEINAYYSGPPLYTGKTYYWRVATLTKRDGDVNAVSPLRSFRMVP